MNYFLDMAQLCGISIILALGLNLINGICGQFSLGHAGFWAVGAYTGAAFSVFLNLPLPGPLNLILSCLCSFFTAAIAGLVIGIPCLRLRGDYLAIATLGFGEIIRIIIMNMDILGGPRGFTGIPKLSSIFWVYFFVFITLIICSRLLRSTHGRAIISIREDEIAAESMGVYTFKYKTLAFVLGAGFAGIAGSLLAHTNQFISPNNFTFMWSVTVLLMVILGGLGSLTGSVMGAILLTLLPEFLKFFGRAISEWRMVIYSLLLIVLMLTRPQGLLGRWEFNPLEFFTKKIMRRKSSHV